MKTDEERLRALLYLGQRKLTALKEAVEAVLMEAPISRVQYEEQLRLSQHEGDVLATLALEFHSVIGIEAQLRKETAKWTEEEIRQLFPSGAFNKPNEDSCENLTVEFLVPHYFASLFAEQYPDEHGGLGGVVTFRNEEDESEDVTGDINVRQNSAGEWLIEVSDERGVLLGTHIENVRRIVIL